MAGNSDLLSALRSRLASFDDDALSALANRGLLRRAQKDLEETTPEILGEENGRLRVRVGDAVVEIPESPNNARCSCPSGTVCRHILSALLFLRASSPADEVESSESPASCAEEILSFDDEAIRKWSGTPMLREARQCIARGTSVDIADEVPVVFTIPAWNITCRWIPGGGLTGMVCSCHAPTVCKHRIVAVLAYQVWKGDREISSEESALTESSGAPRTRDEVRESVHQALYEMVSQGFSRMSRETAQRIATLAVSAHGVDLPRLESHLKVLGKEIDLLLDRDAQADTKNLLTVASRVEALSTALTKPNANLVGRYRTQYAEVGRIELVGVGARRWESRSGYMGLTVYFWDKSADSWAMWTDARPVSVGGLDTLARYQQDGPWTGGTKPSTMAKSVLGLTGAWRNPNGRLSGRPSVQCRVTGTTQASELPLPVREWPELLNRAVKVFGEGFHDRNEQQELVFIAPDRWGKPGYDQIRQELTVPVYDKDGRELLLTLMHNAQNKGGIEYLEKQRMGSVSAVLGILRIRLGRLAVEPISLHNPDGVFNLTLDSAPAPKLGFLNIAKSILKAVIASEEDEELEDDFTLDSPLTPAGRLISAIGGELESMAEGGVAAGRDLSKLRALLSRADSLGLRCCSLPGLELLNQLEAVRKGEDQTSQVCELLLKAYYASRVALSHETLMAAAW